MSEVIDLNERREMLIWPSKARQSEFTRLAFSHESPSLCVHYRDESGALQRISVSTTGQVPSERGASILLAQIERAVDLMGGSLECVERVHLHAWEILYA